jgi:hypothetical protein
MTMLVYRLLTLRSYVMILHRYATTPSQAMPERLRKILLGTGVQQVECAIIVETAPSLKSWSWNLGTFHQYHTAILLLSELYATPERYFEDRIWDCLDYVFELPANHTRREKARLVFQEIVQKSEYFHSLRRIRAPKTIDDELAGATYKVHSPASSDNNTAPSSQSSPESPKKHNLMRERERSFQDPIPSMEFKNFTFLPEVQYYSIAAGRPSASPQSSDYSNSASVEVSRPATGTELNAYNLPSLNNATTMKVDIDWVSTGCLLI